MTEGHTCDCHGCWRQRKPARFPSSICSITAGHLQVRRNFCFHAKDRHSLQRTKLYMYATLKEQLGGCNVACKIHVFRVVALSIRVPGSKMFRTNLPLFCYKPEESYSLGWKRYVRSKRLGTRNPNIQCNNSEDPNRPHKVYVTLNLAQCYSFCVLHVKFWERTDVGSQWRRARQGQTSDLSEDNVSI